MITNVAEYNAKRDHLSYPPIPENVELFQNQNNGFEKPVTIHGWDWSVTFGKWSTFVTFENGWKGWTFPKIGESDTTMYRVTYFSNWQKPQHFNDLHAADKELIVFDGKQQQYKVVVTTMDEPEPISF